MRYTIELREGYLRGELIERDTPAETAEFGRAMQAALRDKGSSRMLVVVRASRAIFRVEEYQLSDFLRQLGAVDGLRIALVADSSELAAAHQYVELIAAQQGISLRSFASEKTAVDWLLA
jgi:hypothetical protein